MDNNDQLDYEIGVMMFRAITCNKSTMLCGLENEWQNANGSYDKEAIQSLFSEANETFEIRYEGEV